MITRVTRMKALKASWEEARPGHEKAAAFKAYVAAQKSNAVKMEKAAAAFVAKSVA